MDTTMTDAQSGMVVIGRISGLYGVRGWLRIFSYTDPRENIIAYSPWLVNIDGQWQPMKVVTGRTQGKSVVANLAGYDDRDAAVTLLGKDIAVLREQLAAPAPGEYYWADLEGLRVVNTAGVEFGVVDHMFQTGANDVVVVKGDRERLIPFVQGEVILKIDLQQGVMEVDWDRDY
jgi:16S rRNA processing protein RimM